MLHLNEIIGRNNSKKDYFTLQIMKHSIVSLSEINTLGALISHFQ